MLSQFACHDCGSPCVMLPEQLTGDALVRCSGCGTELGAWRDFKARIERIILAEAAGREEQEAAERQR